MKLSGLTLLAPLLVLAFSSACSGGDDDDDGTAGTAGSTAGTGTAGKGGGAGTGGTGAGTGGAAAGAAGSSPWPSDAPPDASQASLEAFFNAMSYKGADWVAGTATPMTPPTNPAHGLVQVWFNKTLRQSQADGDTKRDPGSMVVKEIYGAGNSVVGHAAMIRSSDSMWTYYCASTEAGRCYASQAVGMTYYSTSPTGNCSCHGGGTIITMIPAP